MKTIFTTVLFSVFSLYSTAQHPGTLDKSFGEGGKVISYNYEGVSYCSVLQPDGKIIVGGIGNVYEDGKLVNYSFLARYNTAGTPDLSFGDSGRAFYNLGHPIITSGNIYAVALQQDKIIAAVIGYNSFAVMRINEDGMVDKSFGEGGLAVGPEDDGYYAEDMALLPDGRIVITGDASRYDNDDNRSFIACLTPEGKLDNSFGEGGLANVKLSSAMDINTITTTTESKIVIGGEYKFYNKTILMRYNENGTPDPSFGINGILEMSFDKSVYRPTIMDIAVGNDHAIATAGWTYMDYKNDAILVSRVLNNGTPDSSFGTNGYAFTKYEGVGAQAYAVAVQQDGKVVVGGSYGINGKGGITVIRYNIDGLPDSTFAENGINKTVFTGHDGSSSILIQKDDKIVLSGSTQIDEDNVAVILARYNGDDPNKQPLAIRIKRWLQHHGISWQYNANVRYYNVQRSVDGGITYKEVASVSNKTNSYEDATPATTNAFYRLAVVAKDGSRTCSNTVLINDAQSARIFPNPVRDNLQLQGLPVSGKTNVSILDLQGNVRSSATATGTNYSVNTANLSSGSYLLKIQHGGTTVTQPFVKE